MSARGSVIAIASPARFDHPGDLAPEAEKAKTDTAQLELAQEAPHPAAVGTAVVRPRFKLWGPLRL
jgi:hypothetical protein